MDKPQHEPDFQAMAHGQRSGHTELSVITFHSQESWSAHRDLMHNDATVRPHLRPEPDWAEHMLIEVALGARGSSGYSVEIAGLSVDGEVMRVRATEHRLGPKSCAAAVMTHPFAVVITAAHDGPIELDLTVVHDL